MRFLSLSLISSRAKQNERDNLARGTDVPKSVVGNAIGVVGLSTTVNEARLRESLPAGVVVKKIEMRPANEGAILEFETEAVPLIVDLSDSVIRTREKQQWLLKE